MTFLRNLFKSSKKPGSSSSTNTSSVKSQRITHEFPRRTPSASQNYLCDDYDIPDAVQEQIVCLKKVIRDSDKKLLDERTEHNSIMFHEQTFEENAQLRQENKELHRRLHDETVWAQIEIQNWQQNHLAQDHEISKLIQHKSQLASQLERAKDHTLVLQGARRASLDSDAVIDVSWQTHSSCI